MARIDVFFGSVYGAAEALAEQAVQHLSDMGHQVVLYTDPKVADFSGANLPLFITSTTGQGDLPPNIEFFIADLRDQFPLLAGKSFAVIGLGDSSYEHFCGAGEQVYQLMLELQGMPLADLLKIDATETLEPETLALPWLTQVFTDR